MSPPGRATLEVATSGAGDIALVGSADSLVLDVSGVGDVRARDLVAEDVVVTSSGVADVEVCASGTLSVEFSGIGDVDYYCHPEEVVTSVAGLGGVSGH